MTAVDQDPVRAFRQALGRDLSTRLNDTVAVTALVHAAVTNHGWTPRQLADECGCDLADVINAGAVITERLRKAAAHGPVGQRATIPGPKRRATIPGPKRPFCSTECRDNQGWILDDDRNPIRRCDCRTSEAHA